MSIPPLKLVAAVMVALLTLLHVHGSGSASAAPLVYVGHYPDKLSIIDGATNSVITTIPVSTTLSGIAVNPSGTKVYVAGFGVDSFTFGQFVTPGPPQAQHSTVDRPDDRTGAQVHVMYVLPSDGIDRELDMNGTLARSVAAFQKWLAGQVGGRRLRLDTYQGQLDISFVRLARSDATLRQAGIFVRDEIELELRATGFDRPDKIYAVYYDGGSDVACGGAFWPPTLPGSVVALYLQGTPPGVPPCATNAFTSTEASAGYLELSMLHEIFHGLGAAATCAPHHVLNGHVSDDPRDLMYAGPLPWQPSLLDTGRDDYFGHSNAGCLDVAGSAFLDNPEPPPPPSTSLLPGFPADYFGDGKTDIAVYRPSSGTWFIINPVTFAVRAQQWGAAGDIPVPGDYDGDNRDDITVYRPSTGFWFIIQSSNGAVRAVQWGAGGDVPQPGDYDGDGKTDIAVYRPSTGVWFIINSSTGGVRSQQWGAASDRPVPGDYDGDHRTDIAVYRPSTGVWFIINSSTGGGTAQQWGAAGDIPVPSDYDGDGKTDIAVYRPSTGVWFIINSSTGGGTAQQWGAAGDVPVPGDYDGDGKTDIAVYRPSTGVWFIIRSSTGSVQQQQWGAGDDQPLPEWF